MDPDYVGALLTFVAAAIERLRRGRWNDRALDHGAHSLTALALVLAGFGPASWDQARDGLTHALATSALVLGTLTILRAGKTRRAWTAEERLATSVNVAAGALYLLLTFGPSALRVAGHLEPGLIMFIVLVAGLHSFRVFLKANTRHNILPREAKC